MLSIALIANPDSGSGDAGRVAESLRRHGAQVTEFTIGDVKEAVASGPDRIAAAGGDGSLAPVAAAAGAAGIPLAVIPTGTANDFAREHGIPLELGEAVELAARGDRTASHDVGHIGHLPFLNVASIGLPPRAAQKAHGLKGAIGPLAYGVGALRAGVASDPVECTVRCGESEAFSGEVWQVTVACSGAFGAGSSVEADPADGRLDVVVIEARSRARLALHAYGLRTGGVEEQEGVQKLRCAEGSISFAGAQPFNVDGEVVELESPAFSVEAEAFEVVLP